MTVRVLSDAAVDDAVRLTVRARDAAGGQVTSGLDRVASDPDAAPVAPYQAWTVPDALLGGLNVASAALGGTPVVSIDPHCRGAAVRRSSHPATRLLRHDDRALP